MPVTHFAPTQLFEALAIYYNNFQPSEYLQEPYTIACINVITADTDEEAEKISTSMIRMMIGVMTGQMDYMQPPIEMMLELRELAQNPAFQRMLKFAFVGNKETVMEKTGKFLQQTGVNEVMVVSHIYDHQDRVNSYKIFSAIMQELKA